MSYQPSDFPSLAEVQSTINERSQQRYNLWRTLDRMNREGQRMGYASLEEAYKLDPMVREIYALTNELDQLWRVARGKCAAVGFVNTAKRKSGSQNG